MLHHIYVPLKIVKKHALDLIIIGFNHLKSVNESWELKESQYNTLQQRYLHGCGFTNL